MAAYGRRSKASAGETAGAIGFSGQRPPSQVVADGNVRDDRDQGAARPLGFAGRQDRGVELPMHGTGTGLTQITDSSSEVGILLPHHRQRLCFRRRWLRDRCAPACCAKGSAVVTPDKELEEYARDCVRLAQLTDIPEIHERLLQMAREWMAAAMDEPKTLEGQDRHH